MEQENVISREEFTSINTVVLEDVTEILNLLTSMISTVPHARILPTQSYDDAKQILFDQGQASLFVTDLMIPSIDEKGRKVTKNAVNILKRIKRDGLFVPAIVTSGYTVPLGEAEEAHLANHFVSKGRDSEQIVCDRAAELVRILYTIRSSIYEVLSALKAATETNDLETMNSCYRSAKAEINRIKLDEDIVPRNHRKGFWALRNIVLYLSPVDSPSLGLKHLTKEAYYLVEELAFKCVASSFTFSSEARPILDKLAMLGYHSRPAVDWEPDESVD